MRRNNLEPLRSHYDTGVMIAIWDGGGLGYAATPDLSDAGLVAAVERARHWASVTVGAVVGKGAVGGIDVATAISAITGGPTGDGKRTC